IDPDDVFFFKAQVFFSQELELIKYDQGADQHKNAQCKLCDDEEFSECSIAAFSRHLSLQHAHWAETGKVESRIAAADNSCHKDNTQQAQKHRPLHDIVERQFLICQRIERGQ